MIVWELGGGLGHLARISRLAKYLRSRGHDMVLALSSAPTPAAREMLGGLHWVQGPSMRNTRRKFLRMPVNYADLLRCCGFGDAADLAIRMHTWIALLTEMQPDVLVADHAPTGLLAAHVLGVAHVAVGNGFAIPPAVEPWPSIRPWETIGNDILLAAEHDLDVVVERALMHVGAARSCRMREVFGAWDVLDTFPELDHYGPRPGAGYVGVIAPESPSLRVEWNDSQRPRVLAYLSACASAFRVAVHALARCGGEVICVAPDMHAVDARSLASRHLRIACAPIDVEHLMRDATLTVSHGGGGFVSQSLLAGVPTLILPRWVEQGLLARRVEELGGGCLMNGRISYELVLDLLNRMLFSSEFKEACSVFSDRYRDFETGQALFCTALTVEGRLGPSRLPSGRVECGEYAGGSGLC